MYKIITASSDNYITNKYISNFRVKDANVGSAGTLDLFKLYNETSSSDNSVIELSRILLKFDLSDVQTIHNTKCSVNHSSFNATLKLFDVYGGQTTPSDFQIRVYPLSQSFDEGKGRDIIRYSDLGSSNFITASISSGELIKWHSEGANSVGRLKADNIDVIEDGALGTGEFPALYRDVTFSTGKEDLEVDVTQIVSGTIAGLIPDCGFRVSFTPTIETNDKTYFVKRFASRNATDPTLRPQLIIKYDDSIHDYHRGMNFNNSGSLFLNNIVNGKYTNILSSSVEEPGTLDSITGDGCLLLKVMTGSYEKVISGSSYKLGDVTYSGIYSASFLIDKFDEKLIDHVNSSGSITFTTVWLDKIGRHNAYHSGSFTIKNDNTTSFSNSTNRLIMSITNLRKTYYRDSTARFRVFVENVDKEISFVKKPIANPSEIFYNMRYGIIDVDTGKYMIPFEKSNRSTILSVDSDGMYFDLDMKSLPPKRIYKIVFLLEDTNEERIFTNTASIFRVI